MTADSDLRRPPSGGLAPHLRLVRAPSWEQARPSLQAPFVAVTYNVHRWTGLNGRARPDPGPARAVIAEIGADVVALQEVLCPTMGADPVVDLSEQLGLHAAFVVTRMHRRGRIGNAVFSRWPLESAALVNLPRSRVETRAAVGVRIADGRVALDVVSTHLALADRTRHLQVEALLAHPRLRERPTLLMGDMNAWRRSRATEALDQELGRHHNVAWPPSFPAVRPLLSLDRIYSRGLRLLELRAHSSPTAHRASDHLPVVATLQVDDREEPGGDTSGARRVPVTEPAAS